jgi:APA family basic amino acid/polyamine antiporter
MRADPRANVDLTERAGVIGPISRIQPKLSTFDAAMIVVSLVIGIGIFRTPALVATRTGELSLFFAAWILGGIVNLGGALTMAEIGSRYPRAGGYYKVAADCWSPALAFMLNWAQVIMQGVGAAGVAFIGAEYLLRMIPNASTAPAIPWTAASLLALLLGLNFLGIRAGARAQNVLSMAKIVMILGLGAASFLLVRSGSTTAAETAPSGLLSAGGWTGFVAALVAVFYTFGGYASAMNVGADVRDPHRNVPRAIALGMAAVTALYLWINWAYVHALGLSGVASESLVAAGLARACFGRPGETLVAAAIFLSAAGFVNATIVQVPRSYLAMAEDGALPRAFLRVHPRTQAQDVGLAFFGATSLLAVPFLGSFEKVLEYVMFTDSLMVAVVAAAIFVLRRRADAHPSGVFRMPGYPVVPALFVACQLAITVWLLATRTAIALAGLAVFLLGWPLYRLMRRASR